SPPAYAASLSLHTFPTRRSSDLLVPTRPPGHEAETVGVVDQVELIDDTALQVHVSAVDHLVGGQLVAGVEIGERECDLFRDGNRDRKSTRLNSSHVKISYAVFCL